MSTHAIGTGTANLAINLPLDERAILGQAAFRHNQSTGSFLRFIYLRGLEQVDPESAAKIKEVRQRYYGGTMLAVFVFALVFGEHMDLRRVRTRIREERVKEEILL